MNFAISNEIYEWLVSLQLIKSTHYVQKLTSGKVMLDEYLANQFINGTFFSRIISKVLNSNSKAANKSFSGESSVETLHTMASPSSKLYNWNLVCENLNKMGITVEKDVKDLIVAGDTDMIVEILREVYEKSKKLNDKGRATRKSLNKSLDLSLSVGKTPTSTTKLVNSSLRSSPGPQMREKDSTALLDVSKINSEKNLSQTDSLLEFFIISLSKSMNFKPQQAIQMMSDNHKYLAHVIVKGIKDVFEPIVSWVSQLIENADQIVLLISKEEDKTQGIEFVHHVLKPGLISKEIDVVQKSYILFHLLAQKYAAQNLLKYTWNWFVSEQGGFQCILNSIKRHPEVIDNAVNLIVEFARSSLSELFTSCLKKLYPEPRDYILAIKGLLGPLSQNSITRNELSKSEIIETWITSAVRILENNTSVDVRLPALTLLCDFWISYTPNFEENESNTNIIVTVLKKMSRENSRPIKITVLTQLFRLLEYFAPLRNPNAPNVYKILTFCLIENFSNPEIREYLLHNFIMLFKASDSIPIGIVIEPLIKQLQVVDVSAKTLNLFDIEFLTKAVENPKLSQKHAIQLLDLFAKIYLNNLVFASVAGKALLRIITADLESEPIKEYVVKFVKMALATLFSSEKSKRSKELSDTTHDGQHTVLKPSISSTQLEFEIFNAQKRALIIEIIKNIIILGNFGINEDVKAFLLQTNHHLNLTLKIEHKGIRMLLSLYGNADEAINDFQKTLGKEQEELNTETQSPALKIKEEKSHSPSKKLELLPHEFSSQLRRSSKPNEPSSNKQKPTNLSIIRGLKADPKVLQGIQEVRRIYSEKTLKVLEKEQFEKEKLEIYQKSLKNVLKKRMIELGVAHLNQHDVVENIIYPEGSLEADKLIEKKHGLPEIEIVHLEQEEERDRYGVNVVMKKYAKALRYLFESYANSGFSGKEELLFEQLEKKLQLISLSEIWRMLKEHDLHHLINQTELKVLIRLTNTEIMKQHELNSLTLEGFKNFMIQLAVFIYSRSPEDLSHLPVFCVFNELILKCRDAEAKRGKTTILFDDPDSTDPGDLQLNKHLNQLLKQNPEHPIPEAYKKIKEPEISFQYQFAPSLKISESYKIAYEFVDELLFKALRIRLVEPLTCYSEITKAKLKINTVGSSKLYQQEPFIQRPPEEQPKDYFRRFSNENIIVSPAKVWKNFANLQQNNLPIPIKEQIFKQPQKDRHIFTEVAQVLEEVCDAVAQGHSYRNPTQEPIINRVIEERIKNHERELRETQEAEKRRKIYMQHLKEKLKVHKEDEKARHNEKPEQPSAPKKHVDWKRYYEEQLEKYKEKLKDKDFIKERDSELKNKDQEAKKKQFQEFNSKKIAEIKRQEEKIKESQTDLENVRKANEEKKARLDKELKSKRMQELKKSVEEHEKHKKQDEEIHNLTQKKEIQEIFETHEKSLKQLFSWYCLSTHHAIGSLDQMDSMFFKPYLAFAYEFSIYPTIIPVRQVEFVFRSLTKNKQPAEGKQLSLTYLEFKEALIRIAIKGREIFDQIYAAKLGRKTDLINQAFGKMVENHEERKNVEPKGNEDQSDHYEKIDETTINTLQGLFYYLDLPSERQALNNKLQELKSRTLSIREKKTQWKKMLEGAAQNENEQANQSKSEQNQAPKDIKIKSKANEEMLNQMLVNSAFEQQKEQDEHGKPENEVTKEQGINQK